MTEPSPDPTGPVAQLRRIADQDIGANAPWLADELHVFADKLAAEMRGECQLETNLSDLDGGEEI